MKRMRLHVVATLLAVLWLFAGEGVRTAQAKPWVTAYVGGWWFNWDNNGAMPIQNINFKGMTVCDYMAINPSSSAPFIDTSNNYSVNMEKLTAMAHAAGVKATLTCGSWSTQSAFETAAAPGNLKQFVGNLVSYLKARGFDGVDIDWEPLSIADSSLWTNLIIALRQALPSPQYLITVTAGNGYPYSMYAAVQDYVDQINIMTYDLGYPAGGYSSIYAGAIYSCNHVCPFDNKTPVASCNYLVSLFEKAGVKPSKIGIGSEPGGELWNGISGAYQSITGVTSFKLDISYNTIMSQYYNPGLYHWDAEAKASYLSYKTTDSTADWFLSYDDTTALKAKFAYIDSAGIGGLIIYEIGMSYNQSTGDNPFLNTSQEFLDGVVGPADDIPPTVSISSPAGGAALAGKVAITAAASDNVGVAGVQFKVDGKDLSGVLSAPPYSVSLNTDSLVNGTHTISVTAWDAAGNTATDSEKVVVSNTTLPGQISELVLYNDSLSAPWTNVSYGAAVNFTNASPVYSGLYSVEVTSRNWGVFRLHDGNWGGSDTMDCSSCSKLSFWAYSSKSISFYVGFQNDAGQQFKSVLSQSIPHGQWTLISMPVSELNPNNYKVQTVGIMANTGATVTYYVDNIAVTDSEIVRRSPVLDVFGDSLASPWINTSWGASIDFSNAKPVFSGKNSIRVSAGPWGCLSLHYGNWGTQALAPSTYDSLELEVYTTGTDPVGILLESDNGGEFNTETLNPNPGKWTRISFPISALNPSNLAFNRIDIGNSGSQADTFYVDDIRLDSAVVNAASRVSTGINGRGDGLPTKFELAQNYPNPFNPSTTIEFSLPSAQHAVLKVYNVLGEQVATLFDGYAAAGVHDLIWSPKDLSSGVYLYRLQLKERSTALTGRMVYLK